MCAILALSVLAPLGHLSQRERQALLALPPWLSLLGSPSLALPLGELSPQVTERGCSALALSVLAPLGHLSHRERQALSVLAPLGHLSHRERQVISYIAKNDRTHENDLQTFQGHFQKCSRLKFVFSLYAYQSIIPAERITTKKPPTVSIPKIVLFKLFDSLNIGNPPFLKVT